MRLKKKGKTMHREENEAIREANRAIRRNAPKKKRKLRKVALGICVGLVTIIAARAGLAHVNIAELPKPVQTATYYFMQGTDMAKGGFEEFGDFVVSKASSLNDKLSQKQDGDVRYSKTQHTDENGVTSTTEAMSVNLSGLVKNRTEDGGLDYSAFVNGEKVTGHLDAETMKDINNSETVSAIAMDIARNMNGNEQATVDVLQEEQDTPTVKQAQQENAATDVDGQGKTSTTITPQISKEQAQAYIEAGRPGNIFDFIKSQNSH